MAYENKWFDGETMKITIQNDDDVATDFTVHKSLLVARSKYFTALPNFKEGEENKIKFAGWCIDAFRYVLTWMYQGRIGWFSETTDVLMRAYAIADFLMIPKLRNAIMDNLRSNCRYCERRTIEAKELYLLKELGLPATDSLVQFCTDSAAFAIAKKAVYVNQILVDTDMRCFVKDGGEIALDLMEKSLRNLAVAVDDRRTFLNSIGDPAEGKGCFYHVHDEGERYEEGECPGPAK